MLQEQAAFCFLWMSPPQLRKFGFRLILAGHCYGLANQPKHALRCYGSALSIYKIHRWSLIDDHIHYTLVRQVLLITIIIIII